MRESGLVSLKSLIYEVKLYRFTCGYAYLNKKYQILFSGINQTKRAFIVGNIDLTEFEQFSEVERVEILWNRDKLWAEKIEKAHEETGNLFISGGAGHFTSDYNVLDRLKEKGFSVRRMNYHCQF